MTLDALRPSVARRMTIRGRNVSSEVRSSRVQNGMQAEIQA